MDPKPCTCGAAPITKLYTPSWTSIPDYYIQCPKCAKRGPIRMSRTSAVLAWDNEMRPKIVDDVMSAIVSTCLSCGCKLSVISQVGGWTVHKCCKCKAERKSISL